MRRDFLRDIINEDAELKMNLSVFINNTGDKHVKQKKLRTEKKIP